MAIILIILTEIGAVVIYQFVKHGPMTQAGLDHAINAIVRNPVLSIPTQGAGYGLLILLSIPVFESIWFRSFGEALHWRFRTARKYFWRLAAIGLAAGLIIGYVGNFLPMPKNPPILHDMMTSTSGAWLLFLFGITAAPLTEELAFRGFLLPSILNIFRWMERTGISNQTVTRYAGIPASIILTTIPFALLHAQQVSDAWAPLLLIATVSVILCIVRLVTDSVAAGTVVHSAYNFVLFAGLIFQTSGFRHLHGITS
jgi:membrane protease YdiL (CAAX protease family)